MPWLPLVFLLLWLVCFCCMRVGWCILTCANSRSFFLSHWSADFVNLADWFTHLLLQSPTLTIHLPLLRNIITANPTNVLHIVHTNFANYPKGSQFRAILGDLLGRGIFNSDGDLWLLQRKTASLHLRSHAIRSYAFRIVTTEAVHRMDPLLAAAARSGEVVDLQELLRRFSLDTICKFSFGLDPGCLELELPLPEFARAFDTASRLSSSRATAVSPWVWKIKRALNVGSERELKKAIRLINILADEVIRQKRKAGYTEDEDLLSKFMDSIDDSKFLRDIVISFLLAGRDTVAAGLTAFFYLVATHPSVESSIISEINSTSIIQGTVMESYENLKGMHYLQASIYESLRLYPPVQFDSKFAAEDDVLPDGTVVKKGTRVTYHAYAMGRMEAMWGEDCMRFKPERWLNDKGEFVPVSPFKYTAFHAGPRVCLGREMAVMEMKVVAVAVLRRYRIELAGEGPLKFASGLTTTVNGGLPVRVLARV